MFGSQAKKQSLLLSNPTYNCGLDGKVKTEAAKGWKPAATNHIQEGGKIKGQGSTSDLQLHLLTRSVSRWIPFKSTFS